MNVICFCHASADTGLTVHYFSSTMTSLKTLSTTEAILDEIINHQCVSTCIMIPEGFDCALTDKYLVDLQKICSQPSDKNTILFMKGADRFLLFGLADCVHRIIAENENIKQKYIMGQVKLNFEVYQVRLQRSCA